MDPAWLGQVGEELACRALRDLGWRVLHRNLRAPEAELDAVCRDGSTTVVVEVKTGRRPRAGWAPGWRPSERIMPADVARRLRAGRRLARRAGGGHGPARVDLVEVQVARHRSGRPRLLHWRDLGPRAGAEGSAEPGGAEGPRPLSENKPPGGRRALP
ncbi:MAG: YraN family protein, partial [Planctomycetota bacterium]